MTFETRYSTINALWSGLLIEELWRFGVQHFCIAPGSRSAPLTLACAEHQRPIQCHTHFDERGLGFFALGLARASGNPVAVITTSGTAVANLFPAVIEARQSGVPLVIITADRPVELIDCGANQAIEQQGIFSGYPGAILNLPTPDLSVGARWLLTSIDQAFARSCQQGLPLHINCRFREPLYPADNKMDYEEYLAPGGQWLTHEKPYTTYQLPDPSGVSVPQCWHEFVTGKGVVVVGRVDREEDALPAVQLARSLGWPLLVDVQSQLHGHPEMVKHGDLLLASEKGRALFAEADRVFQIGSHLVSKRLDGFIDQHEWAHHLMLGQECRRLDPGHSQTLRLVGDVGAGCQRLMEAVEKSEPVRNNDWVNRFHELGNALASCLNVEQLPGEQLTERWLGGALCGLIPQGSSLFLGNSLPIRLIDLFSTQRVSRVYANRGASGIDGLIATACGCASGEGKALPMVALVGDTSFLHDLNSLQLVRNNERNNKMPMIVIVINNDGGGIFNLLPMGPAKDQSQDYFVMPHGLQVEHGARMFDLAYESPVDRKAFKKAFKALLQSACKRGKSAIIEVKTAPGEGADSIREAVVQAGGL